jgi:hypothetical protein
MERKLADSYNNALTRLQNLMNEGFCEIEKANLRGKRKVYDDAIKWMLETYKGDLKFVSIEQFIRMLQEKLNIEEPVQVVNNASKKMIN